MPPLAAVIAVVPAAFEVMRPVDEMVATDGAELDQLTTRASALPAESFTIAVAWVVRLAARLELTRATVMVLTLGGVGGGVTVIVVPPLMLPLAAVIVLVPVPSAVTTPVWETVATVELELVQVIARPINTFDAESKTVAAACVVAAIVMLGLLTCTVIVAMLGGGVGATVRVAVPLLPPLDAVIVAVPTDMAVTMPSCETAATLELELVHNRTRPVNTLPTASTTVAVPTVACPTLMPGLLN